MSTGDWIVVAVTVLYIAAAVAYGATRHWGSMVIFIGYAVANLGVLAIATGSFK